VNLLFIYGFFSVRTSDSFSHGDQEWLIKFVENRVATDASSALIQKWLKAGVWKMGLDETLTNAAPDQSTAGAVGAFPIRRPGSTGSIPGLSSCGRSTPADLLRLCMVFFVFEIFLHERVRTGGRSGHRHWPRLHSSICARAP